MKKKAKVPLRWAWMLSGIICIASFLSGAILRLIEWIAPYIL